MDDKHCDFCCDPVAVPVAKYRSGSFAAGFFMFLDDDWFACPECDDLIQAGDQDTLRAYVLERYIAVHHPKPSQHGILNAQLTVTYQQFFQQKRKRIALEVICH